MKLNDLPNELCQRIAQLLPVCGYSQSALHLALSSPKLAGAVKAAVQYELVPDEELRNPAQWTRLLKRDIRAVDATYLNFFDTLRLLSAPSLRSAVIRDAFPYLNVISRASHLRSLEIEVSRPYGEMRTNGEELLHALSSLRLTKLKLYCAFKGEAEDKVCFIRWLTDQQRDGSHLHRHRLGDCCPLVESLSINCTVRFNQFAKRMCAVIDSFPALREVTLHWKVPIDGFWRLQEMDSVRVEEAEDGVDTAARIGKAVTCLVLPNYETYSRSNISALAVCDRLAELRGIMVEGAEVGLLDVAHSLEHLNVAWIPRFEDHEQREDSLPRLYRIQGGVMLDLCRHASRLRKFETFSVSIGLQELLGILKIVGSRLEVFGTTLADQDEPQLERMTVLAEAASHYNRNLRKLAVSDSHEMTNGEYGLLENCESVERERRRKLRVALDVLERHAPLLRLEKIERLFRLA